MSTDAIDFRAPSRERQTLCLGGPLHGTSVHVDRPLFTAHSPTEGEHKYRRVAFGDGQGTDLVFVHEGLSQDAAFASYLTWRGLA